MALTTSGQLKVSEIATEFSDTAPHQLSEFYGASTGVPALGQIGVSDFYGAAASAGGGGGTFEPIIASTGVNGTTSPSVVNIYYRRTILSFVYTAAELQAALGVTSGTISDLRFYVTNQPAYQPLPSYAIGVKNGTFSGNPGNTGYTIIKSASSESFTTDTYKEFTLATPFQWTGGDLAFTFAWGQVSPSYNASGTARIGSGTMFYTWSDGSGTYVINTDNPTITQSYRPVLELKLEPAALYDFTTHTFTNATATGAYGPTLANCQTAYSGATFLSSTDYFDVTNGVQYWTVPETATYEFQVRGAQGGTGSVSRAGYGISIVGTKALTEGDVVALIVGQDGIDQNGTCSGAGGGGGGASTVSYGSSAGTAFTNLIAVAGGGGGGGSTDTYTPLQDATSSSSGGAGYTNSGVSGNNGGDGTIGSGCVQGANGGKGWNSLSSGSPPNPIGGTSNGREGGFGGGGRTNPYCGGGGGGYSGGGGGGLPGCSCSQLGPGLGGGSYTSGLDSLTTSGTHTGSGGQITVTKQ